MGEDVRGPDSVPEMAMIYAAPPEAATIKSLLLFFDGVAFIGDPLHVRHELAISPELYEPLMESGLARQWTPSDLIDERGRETYSAVIAHAIESPLFTGRAPDLLPTPMRLLNFPWADWGLQLENHINTLEKSTGPLAILEDRGLVATIDRGPGLPIMPGGSTYTVDRVLRTLSAALIGELVRRAAYEREDVLLQPTEPSHGVAYSIKSLLDLDLTTFGGQVVSDDLRIMGPDLDLVSLPDLLEFREEHRDLHRAYMRGIRSFIVESAARPPEERSNVMAGRRADLEDLAKTISGRQAERWKGVAKFMLGIAGAILSAFGGNLPSAGLTLSGALLGVVPERKEAGIYSYLTEIQSP
jgi:hypothetical protein